MVFVVSGVAGCWLVEWLCVSGSLAFWLLLLHVVFVVSRNPAFWLLLLHVVLLSCILIGWVPFFSSRWQDFLLSLHSNWLSGLEKKEVSIVEMASNSFVISEINLIRVIWRHPFKNKYQSRINFCGESKSGLEIKEFLVDMPFPGGESPDFGLHTSIHTTD